MLYFIPAWYKKGEWKEDEQVWYARKIHSEMDDTVKQIQLFHRNMKYPYCMLLLSCAPNFRHFLHRQGLLRANYWSVFDAVQCVRRKKPSVFSFRNLNWPQNVEFRYTPFAVMAFLNDEKYAHVEFGEDGNPIMVVMYKDGQVSRRNHYDDRGFISYTEVMEDGVFSYAQYLDESGAWKICSFADGHVAVNPQKNFYLIDINGEEHIKEFKQSTYASMEYVMTEVVRSYIEYIDPKDMFCIAMDTQHNGLLAPLIRNKKSVISFFEDRTGSFDDAVVRKIIQEADYVVTDSEDNRLKVIETLGGEPDNLINIPPYDTRVDYGISQQLHVQNILMTVDGVPDDVFEAAIAKTAEYMQTNDKARVVLFTRDNAYAKDDEIRKRVQKILEEHDFDPAIARKKTDNKAEFDLDGEQSVPVLFEVAQCLDALSVNQCVRLQRILVDMAPSPDLFLQISCVSMGIPQITRSENHFMKHGKNGLVNKDIEKLPENLEYYLEHLSNWNHAMVCAHNLGKKYTTRNLVSMWREVLEKVERR